MINHIRNIGINPFPVDSLVVAAPSRGRRPVPAHLEPVISLEISYILAEYFDNTMGDSMPLQEWVYIFEYFKGV